MAEKEPSAGSDEGLRRLFSELREREAGSVPSFAEVLGRPPRRRILKARPLALAAGSVALLVLLAIFVSRRLGPPERRPSAMAADFRSWRSPTDFLLRTPGIEIFESLPSVPEPLPPPAGGDGGKNRKGART